MEAKTKPKLPPWAKVVIAASTLCLGLICGLVIAGLAFLSKANDPAYKKSVANEIATFSDPLPTGFTIGSAKDLYVKTVLFNHAPEQMDISVTEIDVKDAQMRKALDDNFDSSPQPVGKEKPEQIKVASHELEYRTSYQTTGREGKVAILEGRIGDIPGKFFSFTAYSDGSKPFDLKLFEKLTDSITSLEPKTTD